MTTDVWSKQITITDTPMRLSDVNLELFDVNIHIEDNKIKYGSGTNQTAVANVGLILWYRKLNLHKLFMKNETALSTGKVSIVGVLEVP